MFEARYGHLSLEEVGQVKFERYRELIDTSKELLAERQGAGNVVVREFDMEVDVNSDGIPDAEPGFTFQKKGSWPYVQATSVLPEGDGLGAVHVAWLPFDEYPELYELRDEVAWLTKQLKVLDD